MAEVISEAVPSSSEAVEAPVESEEPEIKKRKVTEGDANEKLEHRLGGILCCAVCLDLPRAAVYQCTNGHLMCATCFTHLLADARLRDDSATCPNCRVEISKTSVTRNLAVEKAVSELPSECRYCTKVFPRHSLQQHEETICDDSKEFKFSQIVVSGCVKVKEQRRYLDVLVRIMSSIYTLLASAMRRTYLVSDPRPRGPNGKRHRYRRVTGCRFACVGCPWRGPWHSAAAHEAECGAPRRSAADLVDVLAARDREAAEARATFEQILDLLSCENITFNDLELKPYRTEEFMHKLYYESLRFSAFGHQWVVKAFVNKNQRDPTQSATREITYQVVVRSKVCGALGVRWVVVRGAAGAARLAARVAAFTFRPEEPASPPAALPLHDAVDTNRLLADRAIHFRLIMFQA